MLCCATYFTSKSLAMKAPTRLATETARTKTNT